MRRLACGVALVICGVSAAQTIVAQVTPKPGVPATSTPVRQPVRAAAPASVPAAAVAPAVPHSPGATTRLPIKRVILYKNGVGYFEHLGQVTGNQTVSIDFTSAQLNDALKSLTTLDLGGGRIAGISYNSQAPLARQLDALRLPLNEKTTRAALFDALRGARVTVHGRGGTAVTGRILSFERRTRGRATPSSAAADAASSAATFDIDELVIVTDDGAVQTASLDAGVSVSLADADLRQQVGSYLDLVSAARAPDLRRMLIATMGTAARPLFVSYISEVPVWKTTYRIVLPSAADRKPLLQGWAIIDNTVGEDWTDVELSLVAGAPQSFIQELSQPYYGKRPVVPLPPGVSMTPQTHEGALQRGGVGRLMGYVADTQNAALPGVSIRVVHASGTTYTAVTDGAGVYKFDNLPAGTYRVEVRLTGFKPHVEDDVEVSPNGLATQTTQLDVDGLTESVMVTAEPAPPPSPSPVPKIARGTPGDAREEFSLDANAGALAAGLATGVGAEANTRELGDLFEYHLKERVTIRKNESALVPIVSSDLGVERVSLWREHESEARPLRALWVTNTSGLTLDGGSFMVIEGEAFAGEGLMEPMKAGERRLVSYAADLGVLVARQADSTPRRLTRIRIDRGVITQYREERQHVTFTARNEDTTPREIILEHPVTSAWQLVSGPQPEETTPTARRFRLRVAPKTSASLAIEEVRPIESRLAVSSLTDALLVVILNGQALSPAAQQSLQAIRAKKAELATVASAIQARAEERERIDKDQQRVRENLKALQSANTDRSLVERYARQLAAQEDRLDVLRRESDDLETQQRTRQAELDRLVQALAIDVTLPAPPTAASGNPSK
jgi:hypothetical protein